MRPSPTLQQGEPRFYLTNYQLSIVNCLSLPPDVPSNRCRGSKKSCPYYSWLSSLPSSDCCLSTAVQ